MNSAQGSDQLNLLKNILQRTLVSPNPIDSLTSSDMDALRDVVRCNRDEPFGFEPIGVDLVKAVLSTFFDSFGGSTELHSTVARSVAKTLFEDEIQRDRMRTLWRQLLEAR